MGLGLAGRRDEARQLLMIIRQSMPIPFQFWSDYLLAWLDRRLGDMHWNIDAVKSLRIQEDPEAIFLQGWLLCEADAYELGIAHLERAVAKGYFAAPTLARSRHFDAVRSEPTFSTVQAATEAGRQHALAAFREGGGERLLGQGTARAA